MTAGTERTVAIVAAAAVAVALGVGLIYLITTSFTNPRSTDGQ